MERAVLLAGEYEERERLAGDQLFRWVCATDQATGDDVLVQVLNVTPQPNELASLLEHFDALQGVARKQLLVPRQVLSDKHHPLVVVYDHVAGAPLRAVLPAELSQALPWIVGAGDAMRALHQQRLVHGRITADAFLVQDTRVCLWRFGYAPLLALGHPTAFELCRDTLPPDVVAEQHVTPALDIYAFAVMLGQAFPQLTTASWYQQATDPRPERRFSSIRAALNALENECGLDAQAGAASPPDGGLIPQPASGHAGIVPKHRIVAHADPAEAGAVTGGGNVAEGTCITLTAVAQAHWRFAGWRGDHAGAANPLSFPVTGPCHVIAVFEPIPEAVTMHTVHVTPSPGDAGMVDGGGRCPHGDTLSLHATPKPGWRFDRWHGDLSGTVNPAVLTVRKDMRILASFAIAAVSLSTQCTPAGAGQIEGAGTYQPGEAVTVKAHPQPGWEFERWDGDMHGTKRVVTLMLNSSKHLVAHFRRQASSEPPRHYQVAASVNPPGCGDVRGTGQYPKGTVVKLQAYACDPLGWQFDHWSGKVSGSRNPLELQVNEGIELVAHFKRSGWRREVIVFADPPAGGAIAGGGQFPRGQRIMLTAIPKPGWRFTHWSEGCVGMDNPASLTVHDTTTVIAHFVRDTHETPGALGAAFGNSARGTDRRDDTEAPRDSASPPPGGLGRAFHRSRRS